MQKIQPSPKDSLKMETSHGLNLFNGYENIELSHLVCFKKQIRVFYIKFAKNKKNC